MEMKAICEYNEPEYATIEDGRSKFFRFIMNCKKNSIGVFAMVLLFSNDVMAVSVNFNSPTVVGGLTVQPPIKEAIFPNLINLAQWVSYFMSIVLLIVATVIFVKNRSLEDEDKKNKVKKHCKLCIIIAITLPVFFSVVNILFDVFLQ